MLYEEEISADLARKGEGLAALERALHGWNAGSPAPLAEVMATLEAARAAVRDCAVCLENHFNGLIPLQPQTLGQTIVVLRAADAVLGRAREALVPYC